MAVVKAQATFLRDFSDDIEAAFSGRIISLVAYGSVVNGRCNNHSDVDFFLMLDKNLKGVDDIEVLSQITHHYHPIAIDLSLQYLDEQPRNACSFQDGTKGPLALSYLASATLLLGDNIFVDLLNSVSIEEYRKSIKTTVGYYLDMMRREAIAGGIDSDIFAKRVRKYVSRTLVDSFLFYEKADMSKYRGLKVDDVMILARENFFTKDIVNENYYNSSAEALGLIEAVYNKMVEYTS